MEVALVLLFMWTFGGLVNCIIKVGEESKRIKAIEAKAIAHMRPPTGQAFGKSCPWPRVRNDNMHELAKLEYALLNKKTGT